MRIFKTLGWIVLLTSSFIGIARFTHNETRGFRMSKIRNNLCDEKVWITAETPPSELFNQRYHFLGRGLQSFVFASEDGKTVIKVFNNRYQRQIALHKLLNILPFLKNWARERESYFHSKLVRTFSSYQIAHEELHEVTGLIFSHLNRTTDLPKELILVDPLHIEHRIDPNTVGFIIQKRADMVYPTLLSYIQAGEMEKAKHAIHSLIDLFVFKYQKGIADNDPLIRTNYGFIDGKPVQIDVGPFTHDPSMANPDVYSQEIRRSTAALGHWLNTHCPELSPFLDGENGRF